MIQHVGQNFTKSIVLELLPFADIDLTKHITVNMMFNDINMYHSTSFQTLGIPPKIAVGPDVYSIQYEVVISSYTGSHQSYQILRGTIRVDRLILLNIAKKLL